MQRPSGIPSSKVSDNDFDICFLLQQNGSTKYSSLQKSLSFSRFPLDSDASRDVEPRRAHIRVRAKLRIVAIPMLGRRRALARVREYGPLSVVPTDLYKLYWITAPLCYSNDRNVTRAPPFSYRKNQCLLATSMRVHLLILKTLLIRHDLRNLSIKQAVQHHKYMPANNSSTTNRYHFILNCVFPTRLCASGDVRRSTSDVRMNNALRAATITWFQQLPAIAVTLFPRDPLSRFYRYLWQCVTHQHRAGGVDDVASGRRLGVTAVDRCQQQLLLQVSATQDVLLVLKTAKYPQTRNETNSPTARIYFTFTN